MKYLIVLMILPGFLYAKKMDTLSPMNLLVDSKLLADYEYDGERFVITSKKLEKNIEVKREYLRRTEHLSIGQQESFETLDTIKGKFYTFYAFTQLSEITDQNGITSIHKLYGLNTIYKAMRYTFLVKGVNNVKEWEKIKTSLTKSINFYGDVYSETPQFANLELVKVIGSRLNDYQYVKSLVMSYDELQELFLMDANTPEERDAMEVSFSDELYSDYLLGALDQYDKFSKEVKGEDLEVGIISVESILLGIDSISSENVEENRAFIAIEIAYTVQTKTGKYNVGFVHLGAENSKLLNFMFQRFD